MQQANLWFNRWLIYAVAGLLLVGFGLSLLGEAIIQKLQQQSWFWLGTAALVVFNAGLCLFGQAVIYRLKYLQSIDK